MSLKCLITGGGGMLGRDIRSVFPESVALTHDELDITDEYAVLDAARNKDLLINCAAYTQVDAAESNAAKAYVVNEAGARAVAKAAARRSIRVVHISTDYVFSGTAIRPYPEDHPHSPISVYGRSKAAGEKAVLEEYSEGSFIIRTAWLYGQYGNNFVKSILKACRTRDIVTVVNDQYGQPTWSLDLAKQIKLLAESDAPCGVYHGTNSGKTTWFDFAGKVAALGGYDPKRIIPISSAQFVRPARRPGYSCLGHDAWTAVGLEPMRPWEDALNDAWTAGVFAECIAGQ